MEGYTIRTHTCAHNILKKSGREYGKSQDAIEICFGSVYRFEYVDKWESPQLYVKYTHIHFQKG